MMSTATGDVGSGGDGMLLSHAFMKRQPQNCSKQFGIRPFTVIVICVIVQLYTKDKEYK
jgi:hypothetical protein